MTTIANLLGRKQRLVERLNAWVARQAFYRWAGIPREIIKQ